MKPLEFAIKTAEEAGKRAAAAHATLEQTNIRKKGDRSIVTDIDIELNEFIEAEIVKAFPKHNIFSEELEEVKNGSDFQWMIDPIDGTRLYAFDLPLYGVAMALLENGEPIVSVINYPELNKMLVAEKGKGVTLNGKKVELGDAVSLKESVLLASPARKVDLKNQKDLILSQAVFGSVSSTRHFGAITVDALLVVTEKVAGAMYSHLRDYDAYPSKLMLNEAGAVTLNEKGKDWKSGDRLMITGHPDWAAEMLGVLRKAD